MKYLAQFILIIGLLIQVAHGQEIDDWSLLQFTSEQVAESVGGMEQSPEDYLNDPSRYDEFRIISVPDFYDEQLVVSSIDNMVRGFSDLNYVLRWSKRQSDDPAALLRVDGEDTMILLLYRADLEAIFITLTEE